MSSRAAENRKISVGCDRLAAFFAASHDGRVEAFAEAGGHVVDFVRTVDLDGLPSGAQGHFAMLAAAQMFLELGTHCRRHRVVNEVVEQGEKFSASQFSTPNSLEPLFLRK